MGYFHFQAVHAVTHRAVVSVLQAFTLYSHPAEEASASNHVKAQSERLARKARHVERLDSTGLPSPPLLSPHLPSCCLVFSFILSPSLFPPPPPYIHFLSCCSLLLLRCLFFTASPHPFILTSPLHSLLSPLVFLPLTPYNIHAAGLHECHCPSFIFATIAPPVGELM